jgi:broad specificity phosphatase PhoE
MAGGFRRHALWVQVQLQPLPPDAERPEMFMERVGLAWDLASAAATGRAAPHSGSGSDGSGSDGAGAAAAYEPCTVCIVADAAAHAALVCHALGFGPAYLGRFRMSTAGVTVIEFPFDAGTPVVRCVLRAAC